MARHIHLTDVAAHLADMRQDHTLRAPIHDGGLRIDWFLTTPALKPALRDYRRIDSRLYSDHDAIVLTLNTALLDNTTAGPM